MPYFSLPVLFRRLSSAGKVLLLLLVSFPTAAQHIRSNEAPIDKAFVREAVQRGAALFEQEYIYPAVARKTSQLLLRNLQKGRYDAITDIHALATRLTADMRTVCPDQHVGWRVQAPRPATAAPRPSGINVKGFYRVDILPGNVGYLEVRAFPDESVAAHQVVGAMTYLSGCDAVILDFRQNGGGSLLKDLLLGYFFPKPVHLNDIVSRDYVEHEYSQPVQVRLRRLKLDSASNQLRADTLLRVPSKLQQAPVYVLTSSRTFSAAEAVAYELKALKRGLTVGETTRGGANPVGGKAVNERLLLRIPFAHVENAVTKANWEGVGVPPDIPVKATHALETAHLEALKRLIEQAPTPEAKQRLTWDLETARALYRPAPLDPVAAERYVGSFDFEQIVREQGRLFRLDRGYPVALTPLGPHTFVVDEELRFEFQPDASGAITSLTLLRKDGSLVSLPRRATGEKPASASQ
ncbi:S41 family peptidase [Hymenobacter cellulosivorans]|uniref:S41 family peptidase n=1 Tax=Hymenobacter cellulosivorans TaxID=2932249 RepID=A0ABY4F5V5_9BACT|nr:S41 family peptidase [Hymenobacter cellulosivorans]UOQ52041.1 S41 family peptidase [Hymenobacter cellulosivorans]